MPSTRPKKNACLKVAPGPRLEARTAASTIAKPTAKRRGGVQTVSAYSAQKFATACERMFGPAQNANSTDSMTGTATPTSIGYRRRMAIAPVIAGVIRAAPN